MADDDPEKERLGYDWNNWPVHLGAPFEDINSDGQYDPEIDNPVISGDEINWMVMNALNEEYAYFVFGAVPVAIESQVTIYAFSEYDDLKDVVFKKYVLYNKSSKNMDSTFFSVSSMVAMTASCSHRSILFSAHAAYS